MALYNVQTLKLQTFNLFYLASPAAVAKLSDYPGRLVIFGVKRDVTNTIMTLTYVSLYETACSNITVNDNGTFTVDIPDYININSNSLQFMLLDNNTTTDSVLGLLPVAVAGAYTIPPVYLNPVQFYPYAQYIAWDM